MQRRNAAGAASGAMGRTAPAVPIDDAATRAALSRAADRVAALIQTIPDPNQRIPHLTWTVGEAAAHLVSGARVYTDCVGGEGSPITDLDDLANANARIIAAFPERRPAELAHQLLAAERVFLDASAGRPGEELVAWHEGRPLALSAMTAIALGELLVHGWDIARSLGKPWPIDPADARLVVGGMTWVLPRFVSERTLRGAQAAYEIRVRGGDRFVCRFGGGALAIEPPGGPVDCHISADPVAFLLVGYGRIDQWRPIAQGKLLAWGRKPWLSIRFKGLLRNP